MNAIIMIIMCKGSVVKRGNGKEYSKNKNGREKIGEMKEITIIIIIIIVR